MPRLTVSQLIEQPQAIEDKSLEVVKYTSDGLFDATGVDSILCNVWSSGPVFEVYHPEFKPDEDEIRQTFVVIR